MPRLTLNVDAETIQQAKQIARKRGTSVSALFADFITSQSGSRPNAPRFGPLTRKAIGIVSLPKDKTHRELIEDALTERHGG